MPVQKFPWILSNIYPKDKALMLDQENHKLNFLTMYLSEQSETERAIIMQNSKNEL